MNAAVEQAKGWIARSHQMQRESDEAQAKPSQAKPVDLFVEQACFLTCSLWYVQRAVEKLQRDEVMNATVAQVKGLGRALPSDAAQV